MIQPSAIQPSLIPPTYEGDLASIQGICGPLSELEWIDSDRPSDEGLALRCESL